MIRARSAWLPALPVLPFALGGSVLALSACTVAGPTAPSQPPGSPPSLTVHKGAGSPTATVTDGPTVHSQQPAGPSPVTGQQGTGGPTAPVTVVVRDGAGRHAVTVTAGQRLEVILESTYWNVAGSSQPEVLRQDGATVTMARPASCPTSPAGLGCVPVKTDFGALEPGTAVITATRVSCGEALACAPSQRNFTLTVTVRARP